MTELQGNMSKVTSSFLHVGLNHVQPTMSMSSMPTDGEMMPPASPVPSPADHPSVNPLQAVDMALDQIRAFVEIHADGRVHSDGTISRIANSEEVTGIIEGFLDYLTPLTTHPRLAELAEEISDARRRSRSSHDLLNAYIRILSECRDGLIGPSAEEVKLLAARAEHDIIEEALLSPYIHVLPDGTLVGDPGVRTQKLLLATAREYLEKYLAMPHAEEDSLPAQTLLTRARNAYALEISTVSRMEIVNQILTYWRRLANED